MYKQYQSITANMALLARPMEPADMLKGGNLPIPGKLAVLVVIKWQVFYWAEQAWPDTPEHPKEDGALRNVMETLAKVLVKYDQVEFIEALVKGVEAVIPGRYFLVQVGNKVIENIPDA